MVSGGFGESGLCGRYSACRLGELPRPVVAVNRPRRPGFEVFEALQVAGFAGAHCYSGGRSSEAGIKLAVGAWAWRLPAQHLPFMSFRYIQLLKLLGRLGKGNLRLVAVTVGLSAYQSWQLMRPWSCLFVHRQTAGSEARDTVH